MTKVRFDKGIEANLPTSGMAEDGHLYLSSDNGNMYLGMPNGSLLPLNRSPYYGTCPTAAGTNAKVVTLDVDDDNFSMGAGVMISVKFTYENTVMSPTLNVNNKGAVAIKAYGTTNLGASPNAWKAGEVVTFVHDGSYWMMIGAKALQEFVTELGTNGNYLTWTKNGTANNLTVPYASVAGKVGTSTVGSSEQPIYVNSGTPTAVSSVITSLLKEPNNISISPTTFPLVQTARGNRLALLPASQVIIEKTTDGGTTWVDAGISDTQKERLFLGNATSASNIYIPTIDGVRNKLCGLRITITGMKYNVPEGTTETQKYNYWNKDYILSTERYVSLDGLYLWLSSINDYIRTRVYRATGANPDNWVSADRGSNMYLSGWSGGNYVFLGGATFGGGTTQTSNFWNYRIVCFTDGNNGGDLSTTSTSYGQNILRIFGYGKNGWTVPNNLVAIDHLYNWDSNQNAIFPSNVTAEKIIKSGGTSSQFLKADGSVDSNTYATTSQLPSLPLSIANGGTGKTTAEAAANALIGGLPQWTADPSDDVYLIRRDTGGSSTFGQVKFSTVWNYIKSKISSILGISSTTNGIPLAPTAASGTNTTQIATTAFVNTEISGKADKVSGATNGNFAGLDSSGNLTDSGSKASDFATAAQGTKADTIYSNYLKAGNTIGTGTSNEFNPVNDSVHITPQSLGASQKAQVRTNIDAQETLVSGITLKTINSISLLGSGNINLSSSGGTIPEISTNIFSDRTSNTKTASPKAVYDEIHPAIVTTQPTNGFLPNVFYNLGTITGTVTFLMDTPNDTDIMNIYYWTFDTSTTAPTITWPAGITSWVGGNAPTVNVSKHYEVSVLNGIGVFTEV